MGMLQVADAEILLSQVTARYMDQFRNLQGGAWSTGLLHTLPMTRSKTRLPWLKVFRGFREWTTLDKHFQGVQVDDFAVETKPLEASFEIDRRNGLPQILDEIVELTDGLAEAVAFFDDDLTALALMDGETAGASYKGYLFYDSLAAFHQTHPVDVNGNIPGTWANLYPGRPLKLENLEFGIHEMSKVRAPNGRSMRVYPTHLIVPGTLSQTGKRLVQADQIGRLLKEAVNSTAGAGETNIHKGELTLVVAHELTSGFPDRNISGEPDNWYLACKTPTRKPLTKMELQAPADMPKNGEIYGDDPMVRFGKEASAAVAITQPWFIHKFKG